MSKFRAKLNRWLHDAKASIGTRLGGALRIATEHPVIKEKRSIRPASRTEWVNPLEEAFYGAGPGATIVQHPEVFLYRLEPVWVTSSEGYLFADPKTFLRLCQSQLDAEPRKIRRPIPWLARRISEPVIPLAGRGPGNRGHFLCEHLPRLLLAREALRDIGSMKILVTPGHPRWQTEYLAKLGVRADQAVEGSEGTVRCDRAWFVPNLSGTSRADLYEPWVYQKIAEAFTEGLPDSQQRRALFVTRLDAPTRRLVNEDEIFAAVKSFEPNLERVSMVGMSLDEQIQLFRGARLVVGAHSQSFRNLLFCRQALCVQLLSGRREATNEYAVWATNYSHLGLIHQNQCISLFGETPLVSGDDWVFPLDRFREQWGKVRSLAKEVPS